MTSRNVDGKEGFLKLQLEPSLTSTSFGLWLPRQVHMHMGWLHMQGSLGIGYTRGQDLTWTTLLAVTFKLSSSDFQHQLFWWLIKRPQHSSVTGLIWPGDRLLELVFTGKKQAWDKDKPTGQQVRLLRRETAPLRSCGQKGVLLSHSPSGENDRGIKMEANLKIKKQNVTVIKN